MRKVQKQFSHQKNVFFFTFFSLDQIRQNLKNEISKSTKKRFSKISDFFQKNKIFFTGSDFSLLLFFYFFFLSNSEFLVIRYLNFNPRAHPLATSSLWARLWLAPRFNPSPLIGSHFPARRWLVNLLFLSKSE